MAKWKSGRVDRMRMKGSKEPTEKLPRGFEGQVEDGEKRIRGEQQYGSEGVWEHGRKGVGHGDAVTR